MPKTKNNRPVIPVDTPKEPGLVLVARSMALIFSTGFILFYFSELAFWTRPRLADDLNEWLFTWIAYSILGFAFLTVVTTFHVRDIWMLFLAGAVYGWLGEGVLVQTMYESFPLNISYTGLAWHALITIWVGWYALRKALTAANWRTPILWSLMVGLFWGFWSIFWWVEEPQSIAPLSTYALYVSVGTVCLAAAYLAADWAARQGVFRPGKQWQGILAALFAVLFMAVVLPRIPYSIILLPGLLALVYFALRHQAGVQPIDLLNNGPRGILPRNLLALACIPAAAVAVYAACMALQVRLPTGWLVYAVTMPSGFGLFFYSLYRAFKNPKV